MSNLNTTENNVKVINSSNNPAFFENLAQGNNFQNFVMALIMEKWPTDKKVVIGVQPELYIEISQL